MFTSYFEYICCENRSDNQIKVSIDLYSPEFKLFKEKYCWSLSFKNLFLFSVHLFDFMFKKAMISNFQDPD